MEWRILTTEEVTQSQLERDRQAAEEEEHDRLVGECRQACGHEWMLELPEPAEDYADVELLCLRCPAGVNDVYPDGQDMIYLQHGDVVVNAGLHDSSIPMRIPVTVSIATSKMWTDYGWEYDAVLEIDACGEWVSLT